MPVPPPVITAIFPAKSFIGSVAFPLSFRCHFLAFLRAMHAP
jgi:hypothetical protein